MIKKTGFLAVSAVISILLASFVWTGQTSVNETAGTATPVALHLYPLNQQVKEGEAATWYLTAAGDEPLQYQWKQNGIEVPGATANTLRFVSVKTSDTGIYACTITNKFGSSDTDPVSLTILPQGSISTSQKINTKKAPTNSTAQTEPTTQP